MSASTLLFVPAMKLHPLLLAFVSVACALPSTENEPTAANEDDLVTNATEYTLHCKSSGESVTVHIDANGSAFDIRGSTSAGILFQATSQRPSLDVRPQDDPNGAMSEYIGFDDSGLETVPVDGPKAIELDLAGDKTLLYKDAAKTVSLACRYDNARMERFLGFDLVSSADMTNVKAVGFDIDDTLAFTSPTFSRGFASGGTPAPTDAVFWTAVNSCDNGCGPSTITLPDGTTKLLPANVASTAKSTAKALVAKHQAKGHRVYAITARPDIAGDSLRDYIEAELGIAREDVFFEPDIDQPNNPKGKTDRISALGLDVFYGDSDSDITDAKSANPNIQAIRFLRSPLSSNRKAGKLNKYHPGYFGEPIVRGSYE